MLKLNADKTHVLTVGTSARLHVIPAKVEVVMDNFVLKKSESGKESVLGCYISNYLKCHDHMKHFKKKLIHILGTLSGLQYIAPF